MSYSLSVYLLRRASDLPIDWDNLPAGHPFFDGEWLVVVGQGNRFGKQIKQRFPAAPQQDAGQGPFTLLQDEIAIEADSSCDLFAYRHWRTGELARDLRYGSDGESSTWQIAAGVPQPWEQLLFTPNKLDRALGFLEDDIDAQERARRLFAERRIEQGFGFPSCDASFAFTLFEHLGLTFHR